MLRIVHEENECVIYDVGHDIEFTVGKIFQSENKWYLSISDRYMMLGEDTISNLLSIVKDLNQQSSKNDYFRHQKELLE